MGGNDHDNSASESEYIHRIDQHIQFLEQIIQKPTISSSIRKELSQKILRIKQRRDDPTFYLAVIGEFSSGKSTFINALLRDVLLKTSALVTTATATRISYADSLSAEAHFKTARPKQFIKQELKPIKEQAKSVRKEVKPVQQKIQLVWLLSLIIWFLIALWLYSISYWLIGFLLLPVVILFATVITQGLNRNQAKKIQNNQRIQPPSKLVTSNEAMEIGIPVRQFVQMITVEEELARMVEKFTIYHPAKFLESGIVIIDTPGTNPPEKNNHQEVTQKVVESEADSAIIVIPANQPVSDSLVGFISGPLYHYIHRCVFVITKMDTVRPREHVKLIESIKKRLRDKLSIEEIVVLESAPQVVIDCLTGEEEVDEKSRQWNNKFIDLEEKLRDYLTNSRKIAITESVGRLLTQVFRQSELHLREQQTQFKERQNMLEREVIKDLPKFTIDQYTECRRMIDDEVERTKRKVKSLTATCQEKTSSTLYSSIFSVENKEDLKKVLENGISPVFSSINSELERGLIISTNELKSSMIQIEKHFDNKFSQQYRNLSALSIHSDLSVGMRADSAIQIDTSDVMAVVSQLSVAAGDSTAEGVGFGAGAAIGTMFMPGVGTVVGAILGGVLGGLFGPSLADLKNKSWNDIEPKIHDYFNCAETSVDRSLDRFSQQMIDSLNKRIDTYITKYKRIIETMQQEQRNEKERLNRLQQDIRADLLEIERRIKSIEAKVSS